MQTQIQNTDSNVTTIANPTPTSNPIGKRLARMPHIIALPAETPPPSELKRLIEARIAELNSEQSRLDRRDEDQAFEFGANKSILAILELHLAELRHDFTETELATSAPTNPAPSIAPLPALPRPATNPAILFIPTDPTKNNSAETTETTETGLPQQQHPAETETRQTEPVSSPIETDVNSSSANPNAAPHDFSDEQFVAHLKKVPEKYHRAAADLYEHLHYRAKFARLTSEQREAIYRLCDDGPTDSVVDILAQPPPIGLNFRTSRAGMYRFCADYKRILFDKEKIEAHQRNEQERLAAEKSFQAAIVSDETFRQTAERQIRKRLFNAANDPNSDYQEIRWLLKSLEHLQKPNAQQSIP